MKLTYTLLALTLPPHAEIAKLGIVLIVADGLGYARRSRSTCENKLKRNREEKHQATEEKRAKQSVESRMARIDVPIPVSRYKILKVLVEDL